MQTKFGELRLRMKRKLAAWEDGHREAMLGISHDVWRISEMTLWWNIEDWGALPGIVVLYGV